MTIEFLLRRHVASGDPEPLEIALRSLGAMAAGGIHDQLGGGFHRYATDAAWLVPHFEQMLYDNAQLARVYVHAWALTGDASLLATATAVLDYMLRELATADGGFAASQDADTEGEEGATFVWTAGEMREVLGDAARAVRGRVRGHRRRQLGGPDDPVAASGVMPSSRSGSGSPSTRSRPGWPSRVPSCCAGAARGRSRRCDDKVLAAWNGLAIAALADAARSLAATGDPALVEASARVRRGGVAGGRGGPRQPPPAGRPAPSLVAGRPGVGRRRARGLREPRGRAAVAVRGDVRRALVRGRRRR